MARIDVNRLVVLLTVMFLAVVAAVYDYRIEIGWSGFKFEQTK